VNLKRSATVILAAALGLAAPARAQVTPAAGSIPPDDTPSVKVGGTIFTDYTYTDQPTTTDADGNRVHPSAFNVGRAYINVIGNLSHRVAFRITPDITREGGTGSSLSGSLTFRLKYAYGQLNLDDWVGKGTWVRAGMQPTPYVDFFEGIYRYRFQGQILAEREGFITSSDLGLSGRYNLPGNYGDVHLGYYNGDGYSRVEANDQKAVQVRGTVRPFPVAAGLKGLRLTAFYDADHYLKSADRKRFIAMASFEHKHVNAGVEMLRAEDRASASAAEKKADGWSAWATPRFRASGEGRWGLEGLVRLDDLRPDKGVDARKKRTIAGVSYWFPVQKGVSAATLLDYERVTYDEPLNRPDERRYALHVLLAF
jgi:hypothetical protein